MRTISLRRRDAVRSSSASQSSITPLKCNSCREALSFQIVAAIAGTQTNETKKLLHRDVLKNVFNGKGTENLQLAAGGDHLAGVLEAGLGHFGA